MPRVPPAPPPRPCLGPANWEGWCALSSGQSYEKTRFLDFSCPLLFLGMIRGYFFQGT